jgi:hypothetical protein
VVPAVEFTPQPVEGPASGELARLIARTSWAGSGATSEREQMLSPRLDDSGSAAS